MIQSVPVELSTDHTTVLVLAQEKGWVTASTIEKQLQWKRDRILAVLVGLLFEQPNLEGLVVAGGNGMGG